MLQINDLVFAKLRGHPLWPARVLDIQGSEVLVFFHGTHDQAWVHESNVHPYSAELADDVRNKAKRTKLREAVDEMEREHREGVPKKKENIHCSCLGACKTAKCCCKKREKKCSRECKCEASSCVNRVKSEPQDFDGAIASTSRAPTSRAPTSQASTSRAPQSTPDSSDSEIAPPQSTPDSSDSEIAPSVETSTPSPVGLQISRKIRLEEHTLLVFSDETKHSESSSQDVLESSTRDEQSSPLPSTSAAMDQGASSSTQDVDTPHHNPIAPPRPIPQLPHVCVLYRTDVNRKVCKFERHVYVDRRSGRPVVEMKNIGFTGAKYHAWSAKQEKEHLKSINIPAGDKVGLLNFNPAHCVCEY